MVPMTSGAQRGRRRADALSKERIVEAAIGILDAEGEKALTFRALTTRLATGAGAVYWHVANKDELLAVATEDVVGRVLAGVRGGADPEEDVRALALGLFDAIDAHPWVGAQFAREPWQPALLDVFEAIGGLVAALGVPERAQFDCASALGNYVLGVAGQNAANARLAPKGVERAEFLETIAERWRRHDPELRPHAHRMAAHLVEHDDRAQFLAGINLILAGIATVR
ncbi:TetR/AcrR family transcriptional regulator [Actinosynnema pretiosum]|uniref:TetR family transcriptional regulator n=1 Tax=Actinosynnema pretiosum TaxID=42197 RepID=A0A290Z5V9_9PSEU|nr:TetR/AcrR family transcriptional regulator [Actinosynnema pretiosum]ATE54353.1 TetR family transcriptional regulator [Actinosynnema pretiosum]